MPRRDHRWTRRAQFCHNPDCPARGQLGLGNIRVHSRKERRYRCTTCGRTFAATRDTPFYRLKKSADLVTIVITLLCHGCPLQAIVAAFGLDERTVAAWRDRAGRHGQQLPRASRPARAGRVGARPGRRAVRQGGRPAALDGHGDGRPVAALAGRGGQPDAATWP